MQSEDPLSTAKKCNNPMSGSLYKLLYTSSVDSTMNCLPIGTVSWSCCAEASPSMEKGETAERCTICFYYVYRHSIFVILFSTATKKKASRLEKERNPIRYIDYIHTSVLTSCVLHYTALKFYEVKVRLTEAYFEAYSCTCTYNTHITSQVCVLVL